MRLTYLLFATLCVLNCSPQQTSETEDQRDNHQQAPSNASAKPASADSSSKDSTSGVTGGGAASSNQDVDNTEGSVPPSQLTRNESGSRVRAKYLVGTDGTKFFVGWFDSVLNSDCIPSPSADGVTRCWPIATSIGEGGSAQVYTDSACTGELVVIQGIGNNVTCDPYAAGLGIGPKINPFVQRVEVRTLPPPCTTGRKMIYYRLGRDVSADPLYSRRSEYPYTTWTCARHDPVPGASYNLMGPELREEELVGFASTVE